MFKFLFEFQNGVTILAEGDTKMKAIQNVESKYSVLFEKENFRVIRVGIEIDKDGNMVELPE